MQRRKWPFARERETAASRMNEAGGNKGSWSVDAFLFDGRGSRAYSRDAGKQRF